MKALTQVSYAHGEAPVAVVKIPVPIIAEIESIIK